MAVGTDGAQVAHGVDDIGVSNGGDGDDVVDFYKMFAELAIGFLKIKTTDAAFIAVMVETGLTGFGIALVAYTVGGVDSTLFQFFLWIYSCGSRCWRYGFPRGGMGKIGGLEELDIAGESAGKGGGMGDTIELGPFGIFLYAVVDLLQESYIFYIIDGVDV